MVSILGRIVETVGGHGDSSHTGVHCEVRCFSFCFLSMVSYFHQQKGGTSALK